MKKKTTDIDCEYSTLKNTDTIPVNIRELFYVWIFEMRFDVYYFDYDFSDYYPNLYCGKPKNNVSVAISSSLPLTERR